MLICEKCGEIFKEDGLKCPACGEAEVVNAIRCDFCGTMNTEWVCDSCRSFIKEKINALLDYSVSLQKFNGVKPDRVNALDAISEVIDEIV